MFQANPKPNDLAYLPSRATGYGAWDPSEPLTLLRRKWLDHADNCLEYYHQPDLEALRIHAATLLSHYVLTEEAVWLFLVGESSMGKTALFMNPFSTLPRAELKSNITPKAFLSGKGGDSSMLTRTGPSGIYLFKDFTSILQMDYREKITVMKYLREIWDGKVYNETGGDAKKVSWEGKITAIAAVTYVLDRQWVVHAELGERFLRLNLMRPDTQGAFDASQRNVGESYKISDKLTKTARAWIISAYKEWETQASCRHNGLPSLAIPDDTKVAPPQFNPFIYSFSLIIAQARVSTEWDFQRKEIISIGKVELLTRISRSLWLLVLSHARLFGRAHPTSEDFLAARRVSLDSMPEERRKIAALVPSAPGATISRKALRQKLIRTTSRQFNEALAELVAIGILDLRQPSAMSMEYDDPEVFFTPDFQPHFHRLLKESASPIQELPPNVIRIA